MERQEVVGIFHAKRVILRSSVYSLAITREKGGNRDAQSQTANRKSLQIIKQKLHMESKPELWHLCKSLLPSAKGLSIYFYRLGTATSLFSMGDTDN